MDYWKKNFLDGTNLIGSDKLIAEGKVSWRRSPCDCLLNVVLTGDRYRLEIEGLGEYWQSDTYESVFPGPGSRRIARRIERKIKTGDIMFYVSPVSSTVVFYKNMDHSMSFSNSNGHMVTPEMVNQWFVLERDLVTNVTKWYISEDKI